MTHSGNPGLDLFWEQADRAGSGQHPLQRELDDRIDALARYRRLIDEAEDNGREEAAEILLDQYDREEQAIERLREAMAAGQTSEG
jgi:hypothetical protein